MGKIEQIEQTVLMPDYKSLIRRFPMRGYGYARRVAKILNDSGLRPIKAKEYTANVVHMVVSNGYLDLNVEPAIIGLLEHYYGQRLVAILPDYVRRFPKRKLSPITSPDDK